MNNTIWCGNFIIKTDAETATKLEVVTNLLQSKDIKIIQELESYREKSLYVESENKYIGMMNLHTFLFFHDYQKYWFIFKNFNQVDFNFICADLLSRESYLEFDKIDENNKALFFTDFLNYVNENLYNEDIKKTENWTKNILLSFAFKETFNHSKSKFFIPSKYQMQFLDNLSDKRIFQYNWNTFKKIFKVIEYEFKEEYFKNHSILEFFNPMLKLGYAYNYKNSSLKHENTKLLKPTRNNFENFFLSNQNIFQNMSTIEQKALFKIFIHHNRKELVQYMFYNYEGILKENYSEDEYKELLLRANKSNLNIDLEKYFLFKKLNNNLESKEKEKKLKI